MKYISIIMYIILLFQANICAQETSIDFDHFTIEDGIPHSTINDLLQDKNGQIWIATDDGAAFYDNYRFKKFKHDKNNHNSISNNQVLKLFMDNNDKLWIGTKFSLELYDPITDSFQHYFLPNLPHQDRVNVIEIKQLNDSILLIGTDGGGLRSFNIITKKQSHFLPNKHLSKIGLRISAIHIDNKDRVWIGTLDKGLFVYTEGYLRSVFTQSEIRKIIKSDSENLLIATYDRGLIEINSNSLDINKIQILTRNSTNNLQLFDIIKDQDYLLLGTDGEGLIKYYPKTKHQEVYINSGSYSSTISNNVVRKIFIDSETNLWLGHFHGGISLHRKKNAFNNIYKTPLSNNSLSYSLVSAICDDNNNNIWVGTDGGSINIIKNGIIYNHLNKNLNQLLTGYCPNKILCLFRDDSNNIWIGSYLEGIYIYNPLTNNIKPLEQVYPNLKIENKDIRCITEDRLGNIWIGTNGGGISIINTDRTQVSKLKHNLDKPKSTLSLDWIRVIYEDKLGFIWIGTTYGLNVYDRVNNTIRQYLYDTNNKKTISGNVIFAITEDKSKELWIGTSSGLNKYDRSTDTFTTYTTTDGLPNNIISDIIATNNNNLWLSTNNGISLFNSKSESFTNYNKTDGLVSNTFINRSSFKAQNGYLYFGSISGLSFFKPSEIKSYQYNIPIILTDFKIFNKSIAVNERFDNRVILDQTINYTKNIKLLKAENVITISYSALSYAYSDKIKYEYRLLGFSDSWVSNAQNKSVTYTNLKAGSYTFQVRVSNLGLNSNIKELTLIILPPFYETWWFKLLYILTIATVGIFVMRSRIKTIEQQRDTIKRQFNIEIEESEKERRNLHARIETAKEQFRADELNYKNAQLISTTTLLTHKNEKMNYVKKKIISFSKETNDPVLKKDFKSLISEINNEFKVEEDWNRFEEHFNNVHKDFIKRLKQKYPDLSQTYLKLCIYLKLDLSTKEIASLLNISQRGVEKSRSRLRKKLELNSEINIGRYISDI